MAYSSANAAQDAQRRAYSDLARQYNNKIPWSVRKDFNNKWNAIVQQARLAEVKKQQNPAVPYTNYTPQQQQAYDTRVNTAAAAAAANPKYPDPTPPAPAPAPVAPPPTPDYENIIKQMQIQSQQQIESLTKGFQDQLAASEKARSEQTARMEEARKIAQVNQARSDAAGNLKIESTPAESGIGGTEQFKIRRRSSVGAMPYLLSNTLNI